MNGTAFPPDAEPLRVRRENERQAKSPSLTGGAFPYPGEDESTAYQGNWFGKGASTFENHLVL